MKIIIFLLIINFLIGIYFYQELPSTVATHWNSLGEANGHMPKFLGIFIIPIITLIITLFFFFVPSIDPHKENIQKFRKYYDLFILIFILFMIFIESYIILWNLNIKLPLNIIMPLAIGALFFYTGIMLKHTKRNFFIGIRTPWTLANDKVWEKTHNLGSTLFKISGILSAIGIFFKSLSFIFILAPILLSAITLVIYSYLEFKKEKH